MKYQVTKMDKFLLIFLFILLIALITVINNRRDLANKFFEYQIIKCENETDKSLNTTSNLFITYKENELESVNIEEVITYHELTEDDISEIKSSFEKKTYNDVQGVITTYDIEGNLLYSNKTVVSKDYQGDYSEFIIVFDENKMPEEMFDILSITNNFKCELETRKK